MENEFQRIVKEEKEQSKVAVIIGIILIITSIIFTALGIVIDKPKLFIGALMQMFAGDILIISNYLDAVK